MKKFIYLCCIFLMFSETARAGECNKIIVTSDADYPPISWQDKQHPDKIIGVAIELVERIFADKGIAVESRYTGPWKRVLASINKNDVDLISGLYLNEERKSSLNFVYPAFMSDPSVVFVKRGAAFPFESNEDLQAHRGGMRLGDVFGDEFDVFSQRNLTLEKVGTTEQLFRMMDLGRIEYFVYGLYSGLGLAEELGFKDRVEALPRPVSEEGVYIAFYKKSVCAQYNELISQKIKDYTNDGQIQSLIEKYQKVWLEQANIQAH